MSGPSVLRYHQAAVPTVSVQSHLCCSACGAQGNSCPDIPPTEVEPTGSSTLMPREAMHPPASTHLHIPGSGSYRCSIGAEGLAALPHREWQGPVSVVRTAAAAQTAVASILCHCRRASKQDPVEAILGMVFWPQLEPRCQETESPDRPATLQVSHAETDMHQGDAALLALSLGMVGSGQLWC